ncbi:MAG: DUF4956 domain-containing protein [Oscillospiraceae bacterium]|nr:DUF4956 domain-containing protein [Oscillospiraceae bacterium]MBR6207884.1 DUF4956 domain-containing protein [Oscillospiraceae bacterium]
MSIADLIKNKFTEEFTAISVGSLVTTLALSFLLGVFVLVVYRLTFTGVSFSRSFALSLVMLSMVTSLAILTVRSNVVLSLGMVGALSIVRFRTAIKDPMDTVFMFWSIVAGIITGAGYVTVAILATLLLGVLFMLVQLFTGRLHGNSYLAVIRYEEKAANAVRSRVNSLGRFKLKSRSSNVDETELVIEAKLNEKQMNALESLLNVEGVSDVNIIGYNGSTLL